DGNNGAHFIFHELFRQYLQIVVNSGDQTIPSHVERVILTLHKRTLWSIERIYHLVFYTALPTEKFFLRTLNATRTDVVARTVQAFGALNILIVYLLYISQKLWCDAIRITPNGPVLHIESTKLVQVFLQLRVRCCR